VNPFFLVAALADLTAVVVHGFVGHRLILARLTRERLFSTREFGDADMSRRVLLVTWHAVTAAFACSALMMSLWAFGTVMDDSGPFFVSVMHASFLVVGLAVAGPRIKGIWRRLIPVGFFTSMTTVVLMGWLGSA
jgi:hypothetical protein